MFLGSHELVNSNRGNEVSWEKVINVENKFELDGVSADGEGEHVGDVSAKIKMPETDDPLLAEEIGLHLGDGSMNYYKGKGFYQLRGHLTDDRPHYETRIKPLYKKLFDIDVSLREMPSSGVYGFQKWSTELVDYKSHVLGLPLGKKLDFRIPEFLLNQPDLSRSFLRGYFDTDGCLYIENKYGKPYPRVEFSSISETFTKQLSHIITRLGFRFYYYKLDRKQLGWQDIYRIIIRGKTMTNKWFVEIEPRNPKHVRKFSF